MTSVLVSLVYKFISNLDFKYKICILNLANKTFHIGTFHKTISTLLKVSDRR